MMQMKVEVEAGVIGFPYISVIKIGIYGELINAKEGIMNNPKIGSIRIVFSVLILLLLVINTGCKKSTPSERQSTLYVVGGIWGAPTNFNPLNQNDLTSGIQGLVYDKLFKFNPLDGKLDPWIAESGKWDGKVFKVKIRKGVTFSDGVKCTAKDVKFTYELGKKYDEVYYSNLWKDSLDKIELIDDYTLNFVFSNPAYQEWPNSLWSIDIVPEHILASLPKDELLQGANINAVGTGAYLIGAYNDQKFELIKNKKWWAIEEMGWDPKPEKIVQLILPDNSVTISMLKKGDLDISGNFIPGYPKIMKQPGYEMLKSFYASEPYFLQQSVAELIFNTEKAPFDNKDLRRAIAFSINTQGIVDLAYDGQVASANNLGFLDIKSWMQYYPEDVVKEFGFSYSIETAKKILEDGGFKDINGDGFVETPSKKPLIVRVSVPKGWTDWEAAARVVINDMNKVGIHATEDFYDENRYQDALGSGDFDVAVSDNYTYASVTPYTLLNNVYFREVKKGESADNGNYSRYNNPKGRELLSQLNSTPLSDVATGKKLVSEMATMVLQEMPVVPLWVNGLWNQYSDAVWTGWPDENDPYARIAVYSGQWELGTLYALTKIRNK